MKKLFKLILGAVLITCTNSTVNAQVNSDYDKTIDFTKYSTYSFAGWQDNSDQLLNDLDKGRILAAFKQEFTARNMTLVTDNADVVITLYFVINNKTSTTAYTDVNGGMGYGVGLRRGWGMGVGGVGMGSATTTYSEDDYQVGTMVVDVYDGGTKNLAWQGTYQKTITENTKKRSKNIPKAIKKLMKKYPIDAQKN
ncbi:DUF4136 domain-containing protein [Eudoraea sp.]|uniref:DUF4136 domain-containing protein n=1 Tax=Eudoraea sp. TaxID=1979955 RepID=UPI003C721F7F